MARSIPERKRMSKSKKRTLKDLIRESVPPGQSHDVSRELVSGSDRSVAIILAADVECALAELIVAKWEVTDEKLLASFTVEKVLIVLLSLRGISGIESW